MMDITAQTKLIGEKTAELNDLIYQLPRTCKVEVVVTERLAVQSQFPPPHVSVTVFQWLGGNRSG